MQPCPLPCTSRAASKLRTRSILLPGLPTHSLLSFQWLGTCFTLSTPLLPLFSTPTPLLLVMRVPFIRPLHTPLVYSSSTRLSPFFSLNAASSRLPSLKACDHLPAVNECSLPIPFTPHSLWLPYKMLDGRLPGRVVALYMSSLILLPHPLPVCLTNVSHCRSSAHPAPRHSARCRAWLALPSTSLQLC